jgi:hypothetical protein
METSIVLSIIAICISVVVTILNINMNRQMSRKYTCKMHYNTDKDELTAYCEKHDFYCVGWDEINKHKEEYAI